MYMYVCIYLCITNKNHCIIKILFFEEVVPNDFHIKRILY